MVDKIVKKLDNYIDTEISKFHKIYMSEISTMDSIKLNRIILILEQTKKDLEYATNDFVDKKNI